MRAGAAGVRRALLKRPNSFKYIHEKTVAHCAGKVQRSDAVYICPEREPTMGSTVALFVVLIERTRQRNNPGIADSRQTRIP
jgi:hypothetical protein